MQGLRTTLLHRLLPLTNRSRGDPEATGHLGLGEAGTEEVGRLEPSFLESGGIEVEPWPASLAEGEAIPGFEVI